MKFWLSEDAREIVYDVATQISDIESEAARDDLIKSGEEPEFVYQIPDEALGGIMSDLVGALRRSRKTQFVEVDEYAAEALMEILEECLENGVDWYIVDRVTEVVTKDK